MPTRKPARKANKSPTRKTKPALHEHFHKDGSLWARGQMLGGKMHGYWQFFRKDGVIMRSGRFDKGTQTGEWTTYNRAGKVHKVTRMKSK